MSIAEKYARHKIDCPRPSETLIQFWVNWYNEQLTEKERNLFKQLC